MRPFLRLAAYPPAETTTDREMAICFSRSVQEGVVSVPHMSDSVSSERHELVEATRAWGYFFSNLPSVKGKRVLDVGMGNGPHAVVLMEAGADSYVGVDPTAGQDNVHDFRSEKDPSIPSSHAFPFSVRDIERIYSNSVEIHSALLEDVAEEVKVARPNLAMMNSVTEHLEHPDLVVRAIWQALDRDGLLWINHHGYYSWSGHHWSPRTVSSLDRNDASHNAVIDWKHLDPSHPIYSENTLNRICLDDMRLVVEKYFKIQSWEPIIDVQAAARLTPEIRRRWRHFSLAELLTRTVTIVGKRREVPLDMNLEARQLFHPTESYLAGRDFLHEDLLTFTLAENKVFFATGNRIASHSTNDYAGLKIFSRLSPGDVLSVTKKGERHMFTVSEVKLNQKDAAPYIVVKEAVPESLLPPLNYSDWTIGAI